MPVDLWGQVLKQFFSFTDFYNRALPSSKKLVVGVGTVVVVVEEDEDELDMRTVSTSVLPSLRIARQRPSSSLYLTTALMSATTMPGPRIAPMYFTVMFADVSPGSTRLWQSVLLSTK